MRKEAEEYYANLPSEEEKEVESIKSDSEESEAL